MAVDFGSDILVFPGLDVTMTAVTGTRVVAEAVAKRLITPRGLLWRHPNYGFDLRQFLNDVVDDALLFRIKDGVERQAEEDERVFSAQADVSFDSGSKKLSVKLSLQTNEGPFDLVLLITELNVSVHLAA